jgi:hypothetical protein
MSVARARVLSGFRRLNRVRSQLFQGDDFAMQVSREQMKAEFRKNMGAATSGPEFEALVAGIDEAADMLKHEIIRGDLNEETGRYSTFVRSFVRSWKYRMARAYFHSNHPHVISLFVRC